MQFYSGQFFQLLFYEEDFLLFCLSSLSARMKKSGVSCVCNEALQLSYNHPSPSSLSLIFLPAHTPLSLSPPPPPAPAPYTSPPSPFSLLWQFNNSFDAMNISPFLPPLLFQERERERKKERSVCMCVFECVFSHSRSFIIAYCFSLISFSTDEFTHNSNNSINFNVRTF